MAKRIKGVWGENPQKLKKATEYISRRKPVKSRFQQGKPVKNTDVSDGGGKWFIVFVIFLFFLLIVLALW